MGRKIKFSEAEYNSLRMEMIERIRLLNSQSFTALATIISFWAAGLTFKVALMADSIKASDYEIGVMEFLNGIIFLVPVILFMPLSVKSGENLTQIASLSAYIRVFYEYPLSHTKQNRNWEISNNLLSAANVDRKNKSLNMRFYNGEYTILSCVSFGIYIILMILHIRNLFGIYNKKSISYVNLILIVIMYIIVFALFILAVIFVHSVASMKNTLMKGTVYYVNGYLKRAVELGIIKNEDLDKAIKELNPLKEIVLTDFFN